MKYHVALVHLQANGAYSHVFRNLFFTTFLNILHHVWLVHFNIIAFCALKSATIKLRVSWVAGNWGREFAFAFVDVIASDTMIHHTSTLQLLSTSDRQLRHKIDVQKLHKLVRFCKKALNVQNSQFLIFPQKSRLLAKKLKNLMNC